MVIAVFLLDISVFLPFSHVPKVYPYHWKLLEGHLSHLGTCLTGIRPIREGQPPRTSTLHLVDSLVIYFSSDVFTLANRAQGPTYKFELLPPQ